LLNLQKIEEYEFAEELTPEQRSNICRVIGRFAHLAKRRIQVDNYFATQTIELAYACENYLPEDIMEQVKEYERAEKLNPPQEKRTKSIPVDDLKKETGKVQREAEGRGVLVNSEQVSENINEIPLYKE
jgi:16S rRNA C967 or C1407 C5-methylase (RsmB/RsmF family)